MVGKLPAHGVWFMQALALATFTISAWVGLAEAQRFFSSVSLLKSRPAMGRTIKEDNTAKPTPPR